MAPLEETHPSDTIEITRTAEEDLTDRDFYLMDEDLEHSYDVKDIQEEDYEYLDNLNKTIGTVHNETVQTEQQYIRLHRELDYLLQEETHYHKISEYHTSLQLISYDDIEELFEEKKEQKTCNTRKSTPIKKNQKLSYSTDNYFNFYYDGEYP